MARRDEQAQPKGQVKLPTGAAQKPFVDPRVNPQAAYEAGLRARRAAAAGLPKTNAPVDGGAAPPIPRLDDPHIEGQTMSDQARAARAAQQGIPITPGVGGIVEPPQVQQQPGQPPSPAQLGLLPVDLLTEEATKDPAFRQGHGSMYAAAQPGLALKHGVIRNGQFIPPQKLRPQNQAQLRPETVQDLETLNKLQEAQQGAKVGALHGSEDEAVRSVEGTAAAAAARVGNAPGDDSEKPVKDREKLDDALNNMDEFDLDSFRQAMMKDLLNNPDQKDIIEAKVEPISIDELIQHNRATQRIPITSTFNYTLQSMTGEEDLAIKRLVMGESKSVEVSDRYLLDKYSFMSIAIGLKEINGKPFGKAISDDKGNFNDDAFWEKFNRILKLPLHMLASIGVNMMWFEMRVRKLFVAEKVGNG